MESDSPVLSRIRANPATLSRWSLVLVIALLAASACASGVQLETRPSPEKARGPAFLGVVYTTVPEGMGVVRVIAGSPAERSGIRSGDVITAADDRSLAGYPSRHFHGLIRQRQAGTVVRLAILRRGVSRHFEIELDERPPGFIPGSP